MILVDTLYRRDQDGPLICACPAVVAMETFLRRCLLAAQYERLNLRLPHYGSVMHA